MYTCPNQNDVVLDNNGGDDAFTITIDGDDASPALRGSADSEEIFPDDEIVIESSRKAGTDTFTVMEVEFEVFNPSATIVTLDFLLENGTTISVTVEVSLNFVNIIDLCLL